MSIHNWFASAGAQYSAVRIIDTRSQWRPSNSRRLGAGGSAAASASWTLGRQERAQQWYQWRAQLHRYHDRIHVGRGTISTWWKGDDLSETDLVQGKNIGCVKQLDDYNRGPTQDTPGRVCLGWVPSCHCATGTCVLLGVRKLRRPQLPQTDRSTCQVCRPHPRQAERRSFPS